MRTEKIKERERETRKRREDKKKTALKEERQTLYLSISLSFSLVAFHLSLFLSKLVLSVYGLCYYVFFSLHCVFFFFALSLFLLFMNRFEGVSSGVSFFFFGVTTRDVGHERHCNLWSLPDSACLFFSFFFSLFFLFFSDSASFLPFCFGFVFFSLLLLWGRLLFFFPLSLSLICALHSPRSSICLFFSLFHSLFFCFWGQAWERA